MPPPAKPFLARQGYRRRRLADAARVLPLAGAVAFALPLLGGAGRGTATAGLYLFGVWAALILAARLLAPRLGARLPDPPDDAVDAV